MSMEGRCCKFERDEMKVSASGDAPMKIAPLWLPAAAAGQPPSTTFLLPSVILTLWLIVQARPTHNELEVVTAIGRVSCHEAVLEP